MTLNNLHNILLTSFSSVFGLGMDEETARVGAFLASESVPVLVSIPRPRTITITSKKQSQSSWSCLTLHSNSVAKPGCWYVQPVGGSSLLSLWCKDKFPIEGVLSCDKLYGCDMEPLKFGKWIQPEIGPKPPSSFKNGFLLPLPPECPLY